MEEKNFQKQVRQFKFGIKDNRSEDFRFLTQFILTLNLRTDKKKSFSKQSLKVQF